MKPKTLLVLLLVLAFCGLFVALSKMEFFKPKQPDATERDVFATSIENPVKITIRDFQGTEMVFNRATANDPWEMSAPISSPVKQQRLTDVLNMLVGLKYSRSFLPGTKDGLDDSLTGLDKPNWTIELSDLAGENKVKLLIGRQTPQLGSGKPETYVKPDGAMKTYVVGLDISAVLAGDVDSYRDMTVLRLDPEKFLRIEINGRDSYALANGDEKSRTYEGLWRIVQPVQAKCDQTKVRQLVDKLKNIQAERFIDAGPAGVDFVRLGLDKPQLVIKFIGEKTHTLKLGDRRGESVVAALDDETFFTLPATVLDELQPRAEYLRNKTLLPFNPAHAEKIVIERIGQPKAVFVKISTGWKTTQPTPGDVDQRQFAMLLDILASLQARRWISASDGEAVDILKPARTITIYSDRPDSPPLSLRIGEVVDGEKAVNCRSSEQETVTPVDVRSVKALMKAIGKLTPAGPADQSTIQPETR